MAGDQLCLTVRTQAGSGIADGAETSYGLTAQTAFTGTALTHDLRNDDRLGGSADAQLSLRKLVRNVTRGTPEGISNTGAPNDVLEYRLILSNPASVSSRDVTVTDATPSFTTLAGPIANVVVLAPGVTCSLTAPSGPANAPGYVGTLAWDCPGTFPAGEEGDLTFQVRIE